MSVSHRGVRGGTPQDKPLCPTCRHSAYRRGKSGSQIILLCSAGQAFMPREMEFEAVECDDYDKTISADLYEMKKIAWTITPRARGKVGFAPPPKRKEEDE